MKSLYDSVSYQCSAITTQRYSTSFSLGIRLIEKSLQPHIYALYGFVRFADEIVDTFHDFDKQTLLNRFVADTYLALDEKISLNPILNSFQQTVREFKIDVELINTFIRSMQMDLNPQQYDQANYEQYILGSAEVVGLMCLKIFVNGNEETYQQLKPSAMRLGAVFQKVNFLMQAAMGFISIEQNRIIKIFSVVSVIFLPPTLVASNYGMNFSNMPELGFQFGYPMALGLMALAAFAPYWYFKRKGWL